MIGSAKQRGGLYFFEDGASLGKTIQSIQSRSNFISNSVSKVESQDVMLWHYRLGHPSFQYLKKLFPKLFINKDPSIFQCDFCAMAKHHRTSYTPRPYFPSKPFQLIHSDIWGPSRIPTSTGKRWFVSFVDDHTRLSWIFLMKEKSEVVDIFQKFSSMIETQFNEKIKIFRSDNGREYFSKNLRDFFSKKGIVQQSSCFDTPQQNGIAERKNKHLLEITRALLFTNSIPKQFWGDAVLHAAFLINRMPSRVLNFSTPLQVFQKLNPDSKLISDLPLRIFGCTVFVHNPDKQKSKLDTRAYKGFFAGYSVSQKGFRCYVPELKKYFVTMDVSFLEKTPFFTPHLQGEIQNLDMVIKSKEDSVVSTIDLDFLNPDIPDAMNNKNHVETSSSLDLNMKKQFFEPMESETTLPERERLPFEYFEQTYQRRNPSQATQQGQSSNLLSEPNKSGTHDPSFNSDLSKPIALRKGVRSCSTKHPISNFVSHQNISPSFSCLLTKLVNIEIPRNIQDALQVPAWKDAVLDEMRALEKNRTWEIVDLPKGKKTVGCRWVFNVKYHADGSLERYKARLVAKGFTQTYGIDYMETFAPVAKLNTIRVLLSVAINLDWPLQQLDVKNAFLNGDLEEEVYMDPPAGFEEKFNSQVCKLKKSLYGLKQSPRAWFEKFTRSLKQQNYQQGQADHTMFFKQTKGERLVVLIVYVDDIILTGSDMEEMNRLKKNLAKEFEIKDLGNLKYFLGMEVARSEKGIIVSQQKYIMDMLKSTGMLGCKPVDIPVDPNVKLGTGESESPVDTSMYQRLVGKLIYLSHTRPDIAFAVSLVSQFMHSPRKNHLEAAYRILKYLKGTPGKGLIFKKTEHRGIEAYTDADWAGSITDRRSTSGYCTYVWGNLVTWRSKKQNVVARSSAEAEYRAMANGVAELLWLQRIMNELKLSQKNPMKLFCDNKAAISIANNPVQHDRTKHVEVDRHFIKERIEGGDICIPFIPSTEQVADILTKGLFKPTFELLVSKLGLLDIYKPT